MMYILHEFCDAAIEVAHSEALVYLQRLKHTTLRVKRLSFSLRDISLVLMWLKQELLSAGEVPGG